MEQLELFGEHEMDRKLQSPNPMVRAFGFGPAEKNCQTCLHLVIHQPGQNRYYKCRLRGITNGPATDHRVRWPACGKYEEDNADAKTPD